ncbi:MAG TPA: cyclic nucleotide-binding domain-containing protein [Acidimicrobiales bacterium]|nr:cyclic nucleotide-binding domain-containing protein [Acidimicrobiales bacterium]
MPAKKDVDLSEIWLFSSCSARDLRQIRQSLDEVTVSAGRVLCQEGSVGREFFLIVDGQAIVRRNERKVATLGPGSYFGELALLDRQPRSASVIADTDMTLLVLEQRAFIGVLDSVPSLARKLLSAMAVRLRDEDSRADTDMTLLLLEQRGFINLLDSEPALARRLLSAMAVRLREADSKAYH